MVLDKKGLYQIRILLLIWLHVWNDAGMWLDDVRRYKIPQSHRSDEGHNEQLGGTNHIHDWRVVAVTDEADWICADDDESKKEILSGEQHVFLCPAMQRVLSLVTTLVLWEQLPACSSSSFASGAAAADHSSGPLLLSSSGLNNI